jgi:serine/threonine protein kinase/tetratricopeptide (TPR) repeat protein
LIDEARVYAVAKAALALEGDDRTGYVDKECAEDSDLRQRVEAILQQDARAPDETTVVPSAPGSGAALAAGDMLAHFKLTELLGEGGMGEVWAADDMKLDREVAVKVVRPELLGDARLRSQFHREAKAVSRVNHPNITTIHEIGSWQGRDFIVFERMHGDMLSERLADGPLDARALLDIGLPLARALAFAHERGIVHRDLKPGNVMFTRHEEPKLMDFGLAKALDSGVSLFAEAIAGTPAYMSPEQAAGEPLDQGTDVWSFGALLHHMACGAPPFTGKSARAVMEAVKTTDPEPLASLRPGTSQGLSSLVRRCMTRSAASRPDMAEVTSELESLRRSLDPAGAPTSRRRLLTAALVLVAITVFVLKTLDTLAEVEPVVLAVLPFEDLRRGVVDDSLLAGLEDSLVRTLNPVDGVDFVPYQVVEETRRAQPSPVLDIEASARLLQDLTADYGVTGRVESVGGQLYIKMFLIERSSGRRIELSREETREDWAEHGPAALMLAGQFGVQILGELGRRPEGMATVDDLVAELTSNEIAYGHFVAGQNHLVRGEYKEAVRELRDALEADDRFPLARLRLSTAARFAGQEVLAQEAAARGAELMQGDDSFIAGIVLAHSLYMQGRHREALAQVRATQRKDPDPERPHAEPLYLLGEIFTHWGTYPSPSKAAEAMTQALGAANHYRDHHHVYNHLVLAYAFRGELPQARAALRRWREESSDPRTDFVEMLLDTMAGAAPRILTSEEAKSLSPLPSLLYQGFVVLAGEYELADELTLQNRLAPPSYGMWAVRNRADLLAYKGRLEDAAIRYTSVLAHGRDNGFLEDEGFLGGLPVTNAHALAQIQTWSGDTGAALESARQAAEFQPTGMRALFVLGTYAARAGLLEEAGQARARLKELLDRNEGDVTAEVYLSAVEAEIALAEGRPEDARGLLAHWLLSDALGFDWYTNEASAEAAFRDLAVRIERALGDREGEAQALRALIDSGYGRLSHPVLYVQSLFDLGVLLHEGDDVAGAEPLLEEYLVLWGETAPRPEDAERARELLAN